MCTGKKIKEIREKQGISQYDLAKKVGYLNQSQLSKIETGSRKISDVDLINIAKSLNISIEDLINIKEAS